jgi:uncharacterized membrane protein
VALWRRAGIAAFGGGLLFLGLRRRSVVGAAVALAGGWLSYRAIGGRGRPQREPGPKPGTDPGRDEHGPEASPDSTVERSVVIDGSADELSAFVRDPENLDRVVDRFADVTSAGEDRQRWSLRAPGPLDRRLSWETEIVEEGSGERLRWEPAGGTALFDEWSMEFGPDPGDRGTKATLRVRFDPPGGALGGAGLERLDVVPGTIASETLDRLKSLVETGSIPTLEGNPSGRGRGDLL